MAQRSTSESSAAVQQPTTRPESRQAVEILQQLPNYTPSTERASLSLLTAPIPALSTGNASSVPLTTAPALLVHSNVLYRPSGIITLPEGTPALETSIIGHLRPATFSESRSPPHSIAPSVARSSHSTHMSSIHHAPDDVLEQELARRQQLRAMGAYGQSRGSAPPAYAHEITDSFHFPPVSTHATCEQLPALVSPVTTPPTSTDSPQVTSSGEAMPVVFPDPPEATPEDVNRFIEERVRLAARRYKDGLISLSTQRQTTLGTVFHSIPRLAINKFFAANLNASGQFNPIPTNVRPELGDYHHSTDEYSANINAAVDNLSLPQQPGETGSNYARRRHAHARLSTPLIKGESSPTVPTSHSSETQKTVDALNEARREVFNRGLLQQLHDEDMLLYGQTMVPDQGVHIDLHSDFSSAYTLGGVQPSSSLISTAGKHLCASDRCSHCSQRNKALISKIKGEYDSDADDEDDVPPTPRKSRYVPPHRRPPSRHPKVKKDEPPLQFGDSRPRDQPTRPEASTRPNTRIPGEEQRPRPSQAPPQPRTRVGAAAPNLDPGDDGSSSDSQDSTPDPLNPPPNGPNPPNRHPDPPTPPRQRPNRPQRGATPLVPSPRPQAIPVSAQSNHYDLREPASYFDSVLARNQPRRPQQAQDSTSHREQNPAPPQRTAPHSENHASPINVDSPTSSRNLGAGRPPNDPPPPPPPGGPGSHRSGSSSRHSSCSDNPQARELTPAHFQEVHFTSQEPRFNNEEIFEYLPVMRSEVEIMLAIFQRYERLVNRNLLRVQRGLDSNVQKTSLQSIPRPQKYEGSSDLIEFDEWIFSIIRWMKIANICGPVYTEDEWGRQQLSAIDMQRTSTLATFLGGDARTWYNNVVEDTPIAYTNNANGEDFPTFMEVINGLYRRFIHESSLYAVNEHFERVQYTFEGGVRQLFASLLRFANMMPSPPDIYTFRRRLMISLPSNIRQEVTRMGLTAEVSTVNDIMQRALIVEKGIRAERYYSQQRQDHISRLHKSSKENAKSAKKRRSPSPRKFKKVQGERHSTRPNPGYEKFKRIRDQPKKDRPSSGHKSSHPHHSKDKGKSNPNSKIPTCYGCGKKGHYSNDPSCPEYGKRSSGEKLYHIVDDNSPDNSSVNSASDHESSDEEYHTEVENPPDWTNLSEDEPGNSSGHQSPNNSDAEDPYGGTSLLTIILLTLTDPSFDDDTPLMTGSNYETDLNLIIATLTALTIITLTIRCCRQQRRVRAQLPFHYIPATPAYPPPVIFIPAASQQTLHDGRPITPRGPGESLYTSSRSSSGSSESSTDSYRSATAESDSDHSVDITDTGGVLLDRGDSPLPGLFDVAPVEGESSADGARRQGTRHLVASEEGSDTEFEGDELTELERVRLEDLLRDLYPNEEEDATYTGDNWSGRSQNRWSMAEWGSATRGAARINDTWEQARDRRVASDIARDHARYEAARGRRDDFNDNSGELGLGASAATTRPTEPQPVSGSWPTDRGRAVAWYPRTSWVYADDDRKEASVAGESTNSGSESESDQITTRPTTPTLAPAVPAHEPTNGELWSEYGELDAEELGTVTVSERLAGVSNWEPSVPSRAFADPVPLSQHPWPLLYHTYVESLGLPRNVRESPEVEARMERGRAHDARIRRAEEDALQGPDSWWDLPLEPDATRAEIENRIRAAAVRYTGAARRAGTDLEARRRAWASYQSEISDPDSDIKRQERNARIDRLARERQKDKDAQPPAEPDPRTDGNGSGEAGPS
ncbi:uncharacterized protein EV420DRAFT_1735524 [Desarmillaria tabescens]|uniref:CCHC-type domain-containing protein n=1 Tax=Armillaria tabescens TaxID=1929756 RepID=A0AA39T3V7_ARMTA|nr:uncharacterized protein EV420DRAFT_1735524 [Desarmillaria tabescens]KAK0462656.1 hypothetical protein EV420DRAFT_1735524 [Desarmillaria tabescens]